jgi:hypothetical protein
MADAAVNPTARKRWRIDTSIPGDLAPVVLIGPPCSAAALLYEQGMAAK